MWVLKLAMSIRTDGLQDINNNNTRWTRTKMASTTMMTQERKKTSWTNPEKVLQNQKMQFSVCIFVFWLFLVGGNITFCFMLILITFEFQSKMREKSRNLLHMTRAFCAMHLSLTAQIFIEYPVPPTLLCISLHISQMCIEWMGSFCRCESVFLFYFDLVVHIRRKRTRSPFASVQPFCSHIFPCVLLFFSTAINNLIIIYTYCLPSFFIVITFISLYRV